MDITRENKINDVVDDEDDDIGSSVHMIQSPHLAPFALDVCLLYAGLCWIISILFFSLL